MTCSKDEAIASTKMKPFSTIITDQLFLNQNPSYEVVARYNKLLARQTDSTLTKEQQAKASVEFNELYMKHASKFQRLYEIEEANLTYIFTLVTLESNKKLYESRKKNLLSNIKHHFTKEADVSLSSILIVIGLSVALSGIVAGLISTLLFITVNASPLIPILLLTAGTIGSIIGLAAANLDRRQAEKESGQNNQKLDEERNKNAALYSEISSLNISDILVNNDSMSKSNTKQVDENTLHSLLFPKLKKIDIDSIISEAHNKSNKP